MPRSRKLTAVPFVGKDVPSRASEFSHPDIVIGFTILAYRYAVYQPDPDLDRDPNPDPDLHLRSNAGMRDSVAVGAKMIS